jgi:hypothetical protein
MPGYSSNTGKLRKKLAGDNSIKFTNVPGRGYKFVI